MKSLLEPKKFHRSFLGSFNISKIFKTECGFIVMDRFSKTECGFGATSNAPNYFPEKFFFSGVRASGSGLSQGP